MSHVFKKALQLIIGDTSAPTLRMPKDKPAKKLTERQLIQLESEIGAKLFGELPAGRRREFFCLDKDTWIWHESGKNPETGKHEEQTIRYEIHDNGVLKVLGGARYTFIEGQELENFVTATTLYYEQAARQIYGRDPDTGYPLEAAA